MGKQLDRKEIEAQLPPAYSLGNATYNNSASVLTVAFTVPSSPQAPRISVRIYNISGRTVAKVVDTWVNAGYHNVNYNIRLGSGVYICAMEAPGYKKASRLSIVKRKNDPSF